MVQQANPNLTVAEFSRKLSERHKDAATFIRVLRRILPALAGRHHFGQDRPTDAMSLDELASDVPAYRLLDCVAPGGKHWAPWLVDAVPELDTVTSFRVDYRRAFYRCLKHGMARGLITSATIGVSPVWQEARNILRQVLPCEPEQAEAVLRSGQDTFMGVEIQHGTVSEIQRYFKEAVNGFNKLGRHMTTLGIESISAVQSSHIYGGEDSFYRTLMKANPGSMTQYSRAGIAYSVLRQIEKYANLLPWPRPSVESIYQLLGDERPAEAVKMVNSILAYLDDADSTQANVERYIFQYLGFLQKVVGLDIGRLCEAVADAHQLAFCLIGTFPSRMTMQSIDAKAECQLFIEDAGYRQLCLEQMTAGNRNHEASWTGRKNPFVALFLEWHLENQRYGTTEAIAKLFRRLAKGYIGVHSTQVEWLTEYFTRSSKRRKKSAPSPRARGKALIGQDTDLWLRLVRNRHRLTDEVARLRKKVEEVGNSYWRMRLATALRDELMFSFLLMFQLRSRNILEMDLKKDINLETYQINVAAHRTKAGTAVFRQIPSEGPFSDLRNLLDAYMSDGRPVLLAGRKDSPYLFVTNPKEVDVQDKDGHLISGKHQVAQVIARVTRKHFSDILPPGLEQLSPHHFRDIFTNFAYARGGGVQLAAHSLANTPGVTEKHYLARGLMDDSSIWAFVRDQVEPIERIGPSTEKRKMRKEVTALVQNELSPERLKCLLTLLRLI